MAVIIVVTFPVQTIGQAGTLTFTDEGHHGNTLTDGDAGSTDIAGISYNIYGVNNVGAKVGDILVLAYTGFLDSHYFFVDDGSTMGLPIDKLVIESEQGETFALKSFNVFDELSEAPDYLITGFRDGIPEATQTQSLNAGANIQISLNTDFENVDRVEISDQNGDITQSFNTFVFENSTESAGVLLSSSPTLTFTENSADITGDNIASDGEGGSQAISDIDIQIFNISDEDGTFLNSLDWKGPDFLFSGDPNFSALTYDNNNEPNKGMSVTSADGSAFRLIQFTYYNWGEAESFTNTIKGYRNGTEVASMTFDGFDPGYVPITVTLDASFSNVDDVRIFVSDGEGYGNGNTNHSINNIQVSAPVLSSSPTVTTASQSSVTANSAILGGNVTDNGGETVTDRGIVWSTSPSADVNDNKVEIGDGAGPFSTTVDLLPFGTTIYYRAYAENIEGLAYGAEESFTTGNTVSAELTGVEGWRLFSVPAGISLEDFLAPIWTQGVTAGGDTDFGGPNVYTWNLNALDDDHTVWWDAATDLTNTTLSAGQGVLVYVYSDDNYDGTPDGFPKTLPVTGSEHPAPVSSPPLNSNTEGWTLMGNPFGSPVNWDNLARTNINNAIYIWDPNVDTHDGGQPATEDAGSWITRSGGAGDFDGIIAPFQGFFVQNSVSGTPAISFTQADKTSSVPAFYGKQSPDNDPIVRLELSGQGMSNSAWLRFSPEGSLEPAAGEAWQLQPFSANYTLLASQKADQSLVDIGHYPIGLEEINIPLAAEATIAGSYSLVVTDYQADGMELYLNDLHTGQSLRVEEGARYEFTLNHTAKVPANPFAMLKGDLRKSGTGDHRFTISTAPAADDPGSNLPDAVALHQNYPNPFNPSTTIRYQLPEVSHVQLVVYDMAGRQVATLVNGQVPAGSHQVTFDAANLSSGIYIYQLSTGSQQFTRKLTLIK